MQGISVVHSRPGGVLGLSSTGLSGVSQGFRGSRHWVMGSSGLRVFGDPGALTGYLPWVLGTLVMWHWAGPGPGLRERAGLCLELGWA